MSKLTIFIAVLALTCCANAVDNFDLLGAFGPPGGLWSTFFLKPAMPSEDFIKNLKPSGNENVHGTYVSSQQSSKVVDGVRQDTSSGKILTNSNGHVEEVTMRT
uniref:Setae polypeptide n=1 Tax=Ochrogaster lunifer TaxID=319761 RepID=A0AA49ESV8_OCHLU|nr:setae polypeptide [Ochrogaster lunifer]